jgi:glutamyl-tRNA reductase
MVDADVVAACSGAPGTLFGVGAVQAAMDARDGRPLLLVDLAVPRDFDPAAGALPAVDLVDMDDITAFVAARADERRAEVPAVERIIADEIARYSAAIASRAVAPLVSKLHEQAEEIRRSELARTEGRLRDLSPAQRQVLDQMTRRIVAKLVHDPTVKLKASAGTVRGEILAEAFRDLFGLEA